MDDVLGERKMGVLCHPTSVPGPNGIGELGHELRAFLDYLAEAGQRLWQILPLGPTGYGDSPYQPFSAFAGNPLLVALDLLVEEGLLSARDLAGQENLPRDRVDYGAVIGFKREALQRAWQSAQSHARLMSEYHDYCAREAGWLDDYALFMALKVRFDWAVWTEWSPEIAQRDPSALAGWRQELSDAFDLQRFQQFLFDRQWAPIRAHASSRGIAVIGDMPLFVGHDSADVWSHQEMFYLDARGHRTRVAGVPPDYFSATGQLWGNPLYRWDVLQEQGYAWWIARLRRALAQADVVRLDHFRGFCGYWEVPAGERTAINGRWVRGPGRAFFDAVRAELGGLPIIAEDLGLISADVIELRDALNLPGMVVLQFAFHGDAANPHLPHTYVHNCVAYTATHDNDTTQGWYAEQDETVQHRARLYTGSSGDDIHWALTRQVCNSVAQTVIVPLQDLLGLGSEARLNRPGAPHGNWTWRYAAEALEPALAEAVRDMALAAGRWVPPGVVLEGGTTPILDYEDPEGIASPS